MSLASVRPRPASCFTTRSSDPPVWPPAVQHRVRQFIAEGATVRQIVALTQTPLAVVLVHIEKVRFQLRTLRSIIVVAAKL